PRFEGADDRARELGAVGGDARLVAPLNVATDRVHTPPPQDVLQDASAGGPVDAHGFDREGATAQAVAVLRPEVLATRPPLLVDHQRRGLVPAAPARVQDPPEGIVVLGAGPVGADAEQLVEAAGGLEGGAANGEVGSVSEPRGVDTEFERAGLLATAHGELWPLGPVGLDATGDETDSRVGTERGLDRVGPARRRPAVV